jgi:hypothetical protein
MVSIVPPRVIVEQRPFVPNQLRRHRPDFTRIAVLKSAGWSALLNNQTDVRGRPLDISQGLPRNRIPASRAASAETPFKLQIGELEALANISGKDAGSRKIICRLLRFGHVKTLSQSGNEQFHIRRRSISYFSSFAGLIAAAIHSLMAA